MASDGNPGKIPVTSLVHGSQAVIPVTHATSGKTLPGKALPGNVSGGKALPASGKNLAVAVTANSEAGDATASAPSNASAAAHNASAAARNTDPQTLVDLLNKSLNDSGRPDQYRVAPNSGSKLIQQINPANGEVIGEFAASEFPVLARSIGASGLIVDSLA